MRHFALSFACSRKDVARLRRLGGPGSFIISKIESRAGVKNLDGIIEASDAVLVDRGDLSREIPLEYVPMYQKEIIRRANRASTPSFVATNLLESMVVNRRPTIAGANDIINTLLDGAHGLVLASETRIGRNPVASVEMVARLIDAFEWSRGRRLVLKARRRKPRSAARRRNPGPWVLIADGSRRPGDQGRSAVAAVRALGRAGYRAAVTVTSESSLAAASRYCDRRVSVSSILETDAYGRTVGEELARSRYLTCLPASDAALSALAGRGADLLDKVQLEAAVGAAGLRVPPSWFFDSVSELRDAAREFEYPVVVKPSTHRQKPQRITSPEQLSVASIAEGGLIVQPYLSAPIRSVSGLMWKGELMGAVHSIWLRKWRLDCGNASAAETVAPDAELELRIATLLKDYEGVFNTQFIGPYLLDVHPRVYGTHSLAAAAGVNQIALYCDLLRGRQVHPPPARQGVRYRWAEGDIRHLFTLVKAGRVSAGTALDALRPRRGTAHCTESLTDPGPMLARVRYGLTRRSSSPVVSSATSRST